MYFHILFAILRASEQDHCMARPILEAGFKVWIMHLASNLYYEES